MGRGKGKGRLSLPWHRPELRQGWRASGGKGQSVTVVARATGQAVNREIAASVQMVQAITGLQAKACINAAMVTQAHRISTCAVRQTCKDKT